MLYPTALVIWKSLCFTRSPRSRHSPDSRRLLAMIALVQRDALTAVAPYRTSVGVVT